MVLLRRAASFLELIKFEHTLFALPFAYMGMLLAADGWPSWHQFAWITVAMAAARTLAMSANRLADVALDARNPRTANRPLVVGTIAPSTVWMGASASAAGLALAAWQLSPLAFRLMPGAVVFLVGYPFAKRFTVLSHFILGATDALAPLGAWAAIRNTLGGIESLPAWLLFVIVTFWIGGFDLIYACQDVEVDRREGLHAVPARYGVRAALRLSAACHALTTVLLVLLGGVARLGWVYFVGVAISAALLAYEHAIVRPDDLNRLDVAFFNVNGVISVVLFAATLAAVLMPG
ncbi:MAG TPA: UbiA-like polyprenyltransferase [Anaerolineales bacterium]|nr:UbiA-like polyprenyltransferase [Anaerolineales bacterium]